MKKYIISLDQGTTSSRAIIFDKDKNIIGISQKEFNQMYPKSGWVEHNPMEIWASQSSVLSEVILKTGIDVEEVSAIGITNQRETTILWDKKTGKPVYNAIVWQCRRTAEICDELKKDKEFENYIHENTGLLLDAYFSGTKIKWILDNVKGLRERAEKGEILFGTVDTWLLWNFTNGKSYFTDHSNASRTMLYNIKELKWDKKILDKLNIPENLLPEVKNSSDIYGYTKINDKENTTKVPIASMVGDQQSALFGQSCFLDGEAKATYGTGAFILMNTGTKLYKSNNGLISTITATVNNKIQYALEGSVFIAGALIKWLKEEMELFTKEEETEEMAKKVSDNGGVYLVPALTGLGSPYWDMYARGLIIGLSRGTNKNHIIRAGLEAITYQVKDVLSAMEEDSKLELKSLKVDGGAVKNNFLMQFQADILGKNVKKYRTNEASALGAFYLAGLSSGFLKMEDLKTEVEKEFYPLLDEDLINKFYSSWKKAVERSKSWENS